jgi:hypothetical protein
VILVRKEISMTIYVIRGKAFGDIWDVTNQPPCGAWIGNCNVTIEEHPDMSDDERQELLALKRWLIDNYNAGAHWIVETTPDARHIVELRNQTAGQYRVSLERHWLAMSDYSRDVRNA